jgi:4-diphosphocytidyl-2-C-methyl-D-erythritol kinase
MVLFPNCKINLGLRILRQRDDGFHDLETVFYPLPVRDVLEAVRSPALSFTPTGLSIPGDPASNLAIRAFRLLQHDFPELPFVHIHLHKQIPIGGGLGGGSADGAFMLQLLNQEFRLGLDPGRLSAYAAQLGSDCPFFLVNRPCLGQGRGERLEPLSLDLHDYSFLLVHPGMHVSTAEAFARCRPDDSGPSVKTVVSRPIVRWRDTLVNDFETSLFDRYPVLARIKKELYERGALYASLTGSGSGLFGIFQKGKAESEGWSADYEVISILGKN